MSPHVYLMLVSLLMLTTNYILNVIAHDGIASVVSYPAIRRASGSSYEATINSLPHPALQRHMVG